MGYREGESAHFHRTFEDPHTGTATDPATVRFKYKTPAGATTTLTYPDANLIQVEDGEYQATVALTADGTWWFQWLDGDQVVDEFSRYVEAGQFA